MPQMKGLKKLKLPVGQQKKADMMDRVHDIGIRPSYLLMYYFYRDNSLIFFFLGNFNADKQPL
jgi:hypothetical protein